MSRSQIEIEFKVTNAEFKKSMKEMSSEVGKLNKEFKLEQEQLRLNGTEKQKLESRVNYLNERYKLQQKEVQETKQHLEEARRVYGDNSKEVENLENKLLEAQRKEAYFANEVQDTSKQLADQNDKFKQLGKSMENSGKKMQDIGKKMTDAGGKLTRGLTVPIVAVGGGLLALAKKSGDAADRILDLTEITGMSSDTIQEWGYVAAVAGVDGETMTSAVEGLIKKIPQLESEGGKATESLNKLGIEFSGLSEMTPDEQVDLLINSLAEMEDPLERNAIGSQLFGGAWKDIAPILGMGSDEIARTREEAHELGNVLSEDSLNDANDFRIEMDKMKESIKNAGLQIGADLAPLLQDTLMPLIQDKIVPAIQDFVGKIQEIIDKFQNLSPETQETIFKIIALVAAIGPALVILGTLAGSIGNITSLGGGLIKNWDKIKKVGGLLSSGLGKSIGFLFSPAGMIMIGIAAVIAIGVALYRNWDTIKEKASSLFRSVNNTFNNIKSSISDKINGARDSVNNAIERIKGFFNFSWKLPKLKLPRVSMTGSFSLAPPSVPRFSIKWNKEGAIFTKPTIFNTIQGLQGVGEAGAEAVLPISKLAGMIRDILNPEFRNIAALAGAGGTTINFNGQYQFRDERDIDHFMNKAEMMIKRREK